MKYLNDILQNKVLIISVCSWLIAQVVKTLIDVIINKELNLERLVGAGGMPSCHSATVCALATSSALVSGLSPDASRVIHDNDGQQAGYGKLEGIKPVHQGA